MSKRATPINFQKIKWIIINILPLFLPLIVICISIYVFTNAFFPTEQNTEKRSLKIVEIWSEDTWFIKRSVVYWLRDDTGDTYRYPYYFRKDIQQIVQSEDTTIISYVQKMRNGDLCLETLESKGIVLHGFVEAQKRFYVNGSVIVLLTMVFLCLSVYAQPLRLTLRDPEYKRLCRYRRRRRRQHRERLMRKKNG